LGGQGWHGGRGGQGGQGGESEKARGMRTKPGAVRSFNAVREIGLSLPEVEESIYYGGPALKVRGKAFACMATNKVAEPNSLVVWTDVSTRDELISAQPDVYYLKDHYVGGSAVVLVRLARVDHAALRNLLIEARQIVLAHASKPASGRPGARPRRTRRTRPS
jgi:hypothetical protein